MPSDDRLDTAFHVRATRADLERVERLRSRLQEQLGPLVSVTQRTVFLAALERLEAHLDKLEKDRERRAKKGAEGDPEAEM